MCLTLTQGVKKKQPSAFSEFLLTSEGPQEKSNLSSECNVSENVLYYFCLQYVQLGITKTFSFKYQFTPFHARFNRWNLNFIFSLSFTLEPGENTVESVLDFFEIVLRPTKALVTIHLMKPQNCNELCDV